MRYLLLLIFPIFSFGQQKLPNPDHSTPQLKLIEEKKEYPKSSREFTGFRWKTTLIEFKTVEMQAFNGKNKTPFFKGFKDSYIKFDLISELPEPGTVDIKISGYYKMTFASIYDFAYEEKDGIDKVSYTLMDENKMCHIIITYGPYSYEPDNIVVTTTDNYKKKPMSTLTFILKGFE